jgi:hypothetical protein
MTALRNIQAGISARFWCILVQALISDRCRIGGGGRIVASP